jgi:glycosyltransferase involved in cell wall biosynthesis
MAEIYAQTKILLAPSLVDETFSMCSLEAMSNKIPVLASPNGNFQFLIEDGGFLLDTDNIELWVKTIKELMNDKELYLDISKKAYNISRKYDPQIELEKFEKMVSELIGEPSKSTTPS